MNLADKLKKSKLNKLTSEERQDEKKLIDSFSNPIFKKPLSLADRNRLAAQQKHQQHIEPTQGHDNTNTVPTQGHDNTNTVPIQGHVNTNTVPIQGHDNTNTVPTQGHDNTNTVPTQGHINTNTVPIQGHDNTNTVPTQGHDNTNTLPIQGHDNTNIVPTQGHDNTNTVPIQGHVNTNSVPTQGHDNTNIVPTQGHDNTNTLPIQGHNNTNTVPTQGHDNTNTLPIQGHDNTNTVPTQGHDNTNTVPTQGHYCPGTLPGQYRDSTGKVPVLYHDSPGTLPVLNNSIKNYIFSDMCVELTHIQMKIYSWFLNNGLSGYYNKNMLSKHTEIPYDTVRKIISKLKAHELIFFGDFNQGIKLETYQINDKKKGVCSFEISSCSNLKNDNSNALNSSSSFLKNTTTVDLTDPELNFWVESGLTSNKVKTWMKEFDLSETLIISFLKYARFDLVENDMLKSVQTDPHKWFYGALKKGGYGKPLNYKSHHERLIEQERGELEKLQAELKELEKLRKSKNEIQLSLSFEKMMADPEGEIYKKCFEALPGIHKKRYVSADKRQGKMFDQEMKKCLEDILAATK